MAGIGYFEVKEVPKENWNLINDATENAYIIVTLKEDQKATTSVDGACLHQYEKASETNYYCVGCLLHIRIKNYGQLSGDQFYAPIIHEHGERFIANDDDITYLLDYQCNAGLPFERVNLDGQKGKKILLNDDINIIEADTSDIDD